MSNGNASSPQRLLWAGFFAIFAAGVGFSVRAGILGDWAQAYGFTNTQLGGITGGGLVGFGFIIILGSLIADSVGYGILMTLAFLLHFVSAVMVLFADVIFQNFQQEGVYWCLFASMLMFSIANGLCEVVVNPMTATLFPKEKTHYLNILHAGWPGGLIAGGLVALFMNNPKIGDFEPGWKVNWMIQMSLFLVPVIIYGVLLLGQRLPRSEASEAGVSVGTMLLEFASPILLILLIIHAMVGYVELGTDSWIGNITGTILGEGAMGRLFFVYTSALMFALRFFAGPIEKHLSPLGLLFICAVLASCGLVFLSNATTTLMCLAAVTVYGCGKTFFWPTMLAVVSERFPRGGAVTIGTIGGVGMLSAGFLGGPGIGFKQDYYASSDLKQEAPATFKRYEAEHANSFLGVFHAQGLDGTKEAILRLASKKDADAQKEIDYLVKQNKLESWWSEAKNYAATDKTPMAEANLYGGRMALYLTAAVPACMALLYLLLLVYFRATGGYKAEVLTAPITEARIEKYQGGVQAPMEG